MSQSNAKLSRAQSPKAHNPWSVDLSQWPQSDERAVAEELARHDLAVNVAELEMFGFTVVPAEKIAAQDLILKVREKALDLIERRTGERPDMGQGMTHAGVYGRSASKFLHEDRAFQELMMHPIALALVTYLLGQRCHFSGSALFIKGPAEGGKKTENVYYASNPVRMQLGLHTDYTQHPAPFSAMVEQCNTTWLLSDYSEDEGSISFVPGSHRMRRHAGDAELEERAVPIDAPMGSMVIFNSATWHGSFPRKVPGLRIGLPYFFCRPYMRTMEAMHDVVTPELLAGMPERFATLMGADKFEFGENGVDPQAAAKWPVRPMTWS